MTPDNLSGSRPRAMPEILLWLATAGILIAAVGFSWKPTPFAQTLAAIFTGCALAQATLSYGARRALALFVICIVITFAMENIGASTGFPFGSYHFEVAAGLPSVGRIAIIVGPRWFRAGYFSWVVASILLDGADRQLERPFNFVALPIVAAFPGDVRAERCPEIVAVNFDHAFRIVDVCKRHTVGQIIRGDLARAAHAADSRHVIHEILRRSFAIWSFAI